MADEDTPSIAPVSRLRLGRPRPGAAERAARARLDAWTRERFALDADETVLVAETACGLPGCPPLETTVAFWREGQPRRQFKLFKTVLEAREDDLPPRWMKDALIVVEGEGGDCC
jgi:nitrate reductase delta subunit